MANASRPSSARHKLSYSAAFSSLTSLGTYSGGTCKSRPADFRVSRTATDRLDAMRVPAIALALVTVLALAQPKPKKAADVRVLETTAHREENRITLDGKVRVTSDKPLRGLVIVFDFRSPEREVITTQKTTVDEDTLENGREGT